MVLRSEQMTREATKEFVRQHSSLRDKADNWNWLIDKIYDDFDHIAEILVKANEEEISRHFNEVEKLTKQHEEELKKAYIEGGNDAWKTRDESIEKAIISVEDDYGWITEEDKQNCIEILYELRGH